MKNWKHDILAAILFSFFNSILVMLLWNACLVPAVTGLIEVTWPQSWGIYFLFHLLFKFKSPANII